MKQLSLPYLLIFCLCVAAQSMTAQNILSEAEYSGTGVYQIEVEGRFCDVSITGTDDNKTTFKGQITGISDVDQPKIKVNRQGKMLKVWIESKVKDGFLERLKDIDKKNENRKVKGYLIFEVPKTCLVNARTGSGDLKVTQLASEKVYLSVRSGKLEVKQLEKNAYFNSGSGLMHITDCNGKFGAESRSGKQTWKNIQGNISTWVSSGSLSIEQVEGDIVARSRSGSIKITVNKGSLNLKSSSGQLVGNEITLTQNSSFQTRSGSIEMHLKNPINDLSFDLTSRSGRLKVGEQFETYKKFIHNKGGLKITGNTSSGNLNFN